MRKGKSEILIQVYTKSQLKLKLEWEKIINDTF